MPKLKTYYVMLYLMHRQNRAIRGVEVDALNFHDALDKAADSVLNEGKKGSGPTWKLTQIRAELKGSGLLKGQIPKN